jgi:hypothetical protein
MKMSVQLYPPVIHGMSVCLRALECLAERHDLAQLFMDLNQTSLYFLQEIVSTGPSSSPPRVSTPGSSSESFFVGDAADESGSPLLQVDIYVKVLELHDKILANGNLDVRYP